jgi:para-nitrobenzyl esterase
MLPGFGVLHTAATRESPHHASGNYGLLDQIAGLQWVEQKRLRPGAQPTHLL